jgi:signal peptidase II
MARESLAAMLKTGRWFAVAGLVVVLDQLSKWAVLAHFAPGERRALSGFFNMVLVFNKGAAFSFLADAPGWQTPVLVTFALLAAALISVLIVRSPERRVPCAGLALILGGALGNVVDRLRFGSVVDFIDLHALGWHWPAFNVADSAICVGAALLVLEGFVRHERPSGAHKAGDKSA